MISTSIGACVMRMHAVTLVVVTLSAARCIESSAPEMAGTWSGPMMLELAKGNHTFVTVDVTFNQDGEELWGRWQTMDTTEFAAEGELTGRIARTPSRHEIEVRFSFVGRPPGTPPADGACRGLARASGQLTFNTTVNSAANPPGMPREKPGWAIRLKAFDGVSFEACSPVRYATWTLIRKRGGT